MMIYIYKIIAAYLISLLLNAIIYAIDVRVSEKLDRDSEEFKQRSKRYDLLGILSGIAIAFYLIVFI